jgi:hypothetical protein
MVSPRRPVPARPERHATAIAAIVAVALILGVGITAALMLRQVKPPAPEPAAKVPARNPEPAPNPAVPLPNPRNLLEKDYTVTYSQTAAEVWKAKLKGTYRVEVTTEKIPARACVLQIKDSEKLSQEELNAINYAYEKVTPEKVLVLEGPMRPGEIFILAMIGQSGAGPTKLHVKIETIPEK